MSTFLHQWLLPKLHNNPLLLHVHDIGSKCLPTRHQLPDVEVELGISLWEVRHTIQQKKKKYYQIMDL